MMKSIMKRAASAVLATALVVTSVYCGGIDASAAVKTKKITMNKKKVNLVVGKKFTLKVKKVTPKKGSKAVTYKTSKKKVCTVSKKGVITAKAKGTATITVTSKVNKKAKAKVKVVVRKKTVAPTATAATSTALVVSATPAATAAATATVKPGTPSPKPTKKPTGTPKPTPTVKPAADTKPTEEVLDVMAMSYLVVPDVEKDENGNEKPHVIATKNDDGSVTLDFTGTTYQGARWYFGTRTTTKDESGEDVNEDVQTPLDLSDYKYLVIEGEGQKNLVKGDDGKLPENHDLKTQLLDATDHAEHGGLLEIDTHDVKASLPMDFELEGIRKDVAAFEIYSLGKAESKNAGPITITGVYICKDKAAYDKFKAGNKDDENKDDENAEVATPSGIDLDSAYEIDLSKNLWSQFTDVKTNDDGSVTLTMSKGDADWQAGEFGFSIPEEALKDNSYTKFLIEYKDATAKSGVGLCVHYDSSTVGWESGESDNQAKVDIEKRGWLVATGTQVEENTTAGKKLSTIRFFGYGEGSTITIVSVRAIK